MGKPSLFCHVVQCTDVNCTFEGCRDMRALFQHASHCVEVNCAECARYDRLARGNRTGRMVVCSVCWSQGFIACPHRT